MTPGAAAAVEFSRLGEATIKQSSLTASLYKSKVPYDLDSRSQNLVETPGLLEALILKDSIFRAA